MTTLLTSAIEKLKTRPAEEQDAIAAEVLARLTATPADATTATDATTAADPDDLAWVDELDLDKDEDVAMDPRQRAVVISEIKQGLREIREAERTGRKLQSLESFLRELRD